MTPAPYSASVEVIDRLLTVADLATLFGVTPDKIHEWRRKYEWPHVRIGREFRWTQAQVEQIVALHTTAPAAKPADVGRIPGQTERSWRYHRGRQPDN